MPKRTRIPAHPTNYRVGRNAVIRYVVIHTGETDEGSTPAEGMGSWFAQNHGPGRASSAHQGADTDSICTYVDGANTAYGAPGVNATGYHVEHAGRAGQTVSQWADRDSLLILDNGALAVAEACVRYDVPARYLTDAQLRAGVERGIITHAQASRVLGGDHTDPGPNFPLDAYLRLVRSHVARITGATAPSTPERDWFDMATTAELRAVLIEAMKDKAVLDEITRYVWTGNPSVASPDGKTRWTGGSMVRDTDLLTRKLIADVGALRGIVVELAGGAQLSASQIEAAAKAGAAAALDERIVAAAVTLDVTPPAGGTA